MNSDQEMLGIVSLKLVAHSQKLKERKLKKLQLLLRRLHFFVVRKMAIVHMILIFCKLVQASLHYVTS